VNQAESASLSSISGLSPSVKSRILFGRALHYKEAQKSRGHNVLLASLGGSSGAYMYSGIKQAESTAYEHGVI